MDFLTLCITASAQELLFTEPIMDGHVPEDNLKRMGPDLTRPENQLRRRRIRPLAAWHGLAESVPVFARFLLIRMNNMLIIYSVLTLSSVSK